MPEQYREDHTDQNDSDSARHLRLMLSLIAVLVAAACLVMMGQLVEELDVLFSRQSLGGSTTEDVTRR